MSTKLAPEILELIADQVDSEDTLKALVRTRRNWYRWLEPSLYRYNAPHHHSSALRWAARTGQEATVRNWLDAVVHTRPATLLDLPLQEQVNIALYHAAEYGHDRVFQLLLGVEGADVNAVSRVAGRPTAVREPLPHAGGERPVRRETPLIAAARWGNFAVVKILLEMEVDFQARDCEKATALFVAATGGHDAVVELLLADGRLDLEEDDHRNHKDDTPLLAATAGGHEGVVEMLIRSGRVKPDATNKELVTPLLVALDASYCSIALRLIRTGAVDAGHGDQDGRMPFCVALVGVDHGLAPALREMLARRAVGVQTPVMGLPPLSVAARRGSVPAVAILLAAGANPHRLDLFGCTALCHAAWSGVEAVVELLLAVPGTQVNRQDKIGRTALYTAAQRGHAAVVKLLLDAGARPRIINNPYQRHTALSEAVFHGHLEVVQLLLATERVSAADGEYQGSELVYSAALGGHTEIIKLLVAAGADPDIRHVTGGRRSLLDVLNEAFGERRDVFADYSERLQEGWLGFPGGSPC